MNKLYKVFGLIALLIVTTLASSTLVSATDFDPSRSLTIDEQHPDRAVLIATAVDYGDNPYLKQLRILENGNVYSNSLGSALTNCQGDSSCTLVQVVLGESATTKTYTAQVQDYHDVWFTSQSVTIQFLGPNEAPLWTSLTKENQLIEPKVGETAGFHEFYDLSTYTTDSIIPAGTINYSIVGITPKVNDKDSLECTIEGTKISCKPVLYATGTFTVTVRANDGSKSSDASFTVSVIKATIHQSHLARALQTYQ